MWKRVIGTYLIAALLVVTVGCTCQDEYIRLPDSSPAPWTHRAFHNDPSHFQFAVVGDRTGGARPGVFERAVQQLNLLQPEFVISVGDFIEGYENHKAVIKQQWEEFDGIIAELEMPFFYVAGNHDLSNDAMHQLWADRRGPTYYHFLYRNILFICLNTEDPPISREAEYPPEFMEFVKRFKTLQRQDPAAAQALGQRLKQNGTMDAWLLRTPANIGDTQRDYVAAALAQYPDVRWTFVLMHRPAWKSGSNNFNKIESLLTRRPYTVIAGHYHQYSHEIRFGRDYITMGVTGGYAEADQRDGGASEGITPFDHILWVTAQDNGPRIANLKLDGIFGKERLMLTEAGAEAAEEE